MAYAGIQMFMEKLNQLINCYDIPFINDPAIIIERPQFQLLYQELGSIIQTLFINDHQDVEKVNDLKQRFIYAAEKAEYIVDLFLSGVHYRNNGHFPTYGDLKLSLKLDDVRKSFKSLKMEFTKMDSSREKETVNQLDAAQSSISRNSLGRKILMDEVYVGIDRDAELIRDKLVEDQKKLDVVSIVGMGGIGKTTLATRVFNDGFIKYHFYVRVWITVSHIYDKRDVLNQIMESIPTQLDLENTSDSRLREIVYKHLMGKRYLIVIDDIWHIETWDNLKLFFPNDETGSRILLTSRLTKVAKHAHANGLIHHLGYLNNEQGWELLCHKVFHGNEYPEWSINPGMQIVENCQGLPLAVVVIAGVLAKDAWNKKFWVEIASRTSSYIVSDQNGCMETLALSYSHLPRHLRECFLYLGGFPEDYKFKVKSLIWLWVAEGFIQHDGNRSLDNIAKSYLMDLINRNLVIVVDEGNSSGGVKACKMHDLVRELCLEKAKEELFILQSRLNSPPQFSSVITPPYKPLRKFFNKDSYYPDFSHSSAQNPRSILYFNNVFSDDITKYFRSFVLLRVLDLQMCELNDLPKGMELLVHLRYLAIWISSKGFPSSIFDLWSLQTLIYITNHATTELPSNISDMVNLRHLTSYYPYVRKMRTIFVLPPIEKPLNLETISDMEFGYAVDNLPNYFPYIKELTYRTYVHEGIDFKSLTSLKKLKLIGNFRRGDRITFPATLKTLTLISSDLQWSDMSIIQSLPNLQVLKLKDDAFKGSCWNTDGQEFPQLKFLGLEILDIKQWEAYSTSFPCLRRLEIFSCKRLNEIPFEIGDIPTLELIQIKKCGQSLGESVRRIQEEQHDLGNYDLKIEILEGR